MRSAVALLAVLGCSSHYMPRTHGRVALTIQDGKPVYVRDGLMFDHGFLGGGLVAAVAGNPAAMAAANAYHDHLRDGLLEILGGTVGMLGGAAWATAQAVNRPDQQGANLAMPIGLVVVGAVFMAVGAGTAVSAEPYRWDAINIYNDGPETAPLAPPGWSAARADMHDALPMKPSLPGAPVEPKASLGMR